MTCFINNIGLGYQFAAAGAVVYRKAKESGLGHQVPTDWFTEDVSRRRCAYAADFASLEAHRNRYGHRAGDAGGGAGLAAADDDHRARLGPGSGLDLFARVIVDALQNKLDEFRHRLPRGRGRHIAVDAVARSPRTDPCSPGRSPLRS